MRWPKSDLDCNVTENKNTYSHYIPECSLSRLWELCEMLSHIWPLDDSSASPPGPTLCFLFTVALSGNM